ncbi:tetratricopeptide repeat protein [Jeotgalibacillus campisalis]|uniref:Tetratrico peptide repeat group 5 domain-containing protein n=1 Tax=Jeotgalibacillus campisalis TaxID=220754 RepID=A0A0C2W2U0_9BACL|nr:tetratricopeptide repeat protein [Jeotgalibacillus campisalis]KIL50936.1 hypothetical protein KR50_08170 [Jeotgalibacillus campisalis]
MKFDVLGKEADAVPNYKKALDTGIMRTFVGSGSTYRLLGLYEEAKKTIKRGTELFKENKVMPIFLSMTLYNLEHHEEAMEMLLSGLLEQAGDKEVLSYKKAIQFYSAHQEEKRK